MNKQNTPSIEPQYYQEDEIDLKQLFKSLADRKWFIFGFTGFVTVLAISYSLSIQPTYSSSISFLSPSQSSVIQLNKIKLTSETSETIYRNFLNNITSSKLHKDVFIKHGYLDRLNFNNEIIDNMDAYINTFIDSIQIKPVKNSKNEVINYEKPTVVMMKGSNSEIISDFLNDLSITANKKTVDDFLFVIKQRIAIKLNEISIQRDLLLSSEKYNRLSKIERIKIEDSQKINEINDQIDGLRIKAKKNRLNKLQLLNDEILIADELGIIDNNFKNINSKNASDSSITIEIDKGNQKFPKWYLYGKKALSKEVDILKDRTNDDPYIPEIIDLQNKLILIESNQVLKTLESRIDDSPFIAEITKLDIETIKLKSFKPSSLGINAMQINQQSYPLKTPIAPKRKMIVSVAFIAGFILSILLSFIMNAFRTE